MSLRVFGNEVVLYTLLSSRTGVSRRDGVYCYTQSERQRQRQRERAMKTKLLTRRQTKKQQDRPPEPFVAAINDDTGASNLEGVKDFC